MAYQKIYLGKNFTFVRPASGEKEFDVLNYHENPFDFLTCEIINSTSYPPPKAFVSDSEAGRIKLSGFDQIPQTTPLEIFVQGVVSQKTVNITEEKKVLLSDKTLAAAKAAPGVAISATWAGIKKYAMIFIGLSILFYMISGTQAGDTVNRVWSWFNAARVVEMARDFDARIVTNKHPVYESSGFVYVNARYKEKYGDKGDLKKLYHFVGNRADDNDGKMGFFVMADVALDTTGHPLKMTKGNAEDYCDEIGGTLLNRAELETYLAQQYAGVDNFFWPIIRRSYVAEWSSKSFSWMFGRSWLYLKEDGENPTEKTPQNDFVVASNGIEAAFRCGFPETFYKRAE